VSHHAVPNNNHLLEASKDLTNLFCAEPPHVTATRDERCFFADSTASRDGRQHLSAGGTQWMEGGMKVEARDLTVGVVAIAVVDESVKCVRDAIDWDC
jgi:hypothetical protein